MEMMTKLSMAVALIAALLTVSVARTAEAQENRGQLVAYVWAENAKSPSYSPSEKYRFNTTKGAVTITRSNTGVYVVKLANLATQGGHAQVVAYGADNSHCKIVRWNPAGKDQEIHVSCFRTDGSPADSQFALAFFN
jgi:hypothetical protein